MINRIGKIKLAAAAASLALGMLPSVGWSSHPVAPQVNGQVTALPGGHSIEVTNHLYHIQQGSPAEKTVLHLTVGQQVRLMFDGTAEPLKAEVVAITAGAESGGSQ